MQHIKWIIGIAVGAILGFSYWYFIGLRHYFFRDKQYNLRGINGRPAGDSATLDHVISRWCDQNKLIRVADSVLRLNFFYAKVKEG
ncbi:MAG: hypothetical protein ABIR06_11405 [Cyclobacteriaceae bacterium]